MREEQIGGLTELPFSFLSRVVGTHVLVALISIPFACQYVLLTIFPKAMHVHFSKLKSAKSKTPFFPPPSRSIQCWLSGGHFFGLCVVVFKNKIQITLYTPIPGRPLPTLFPVFHRPSGISLLSASCLFNELLLNGYLDRPPHLL